MPIKPISPKSRLSSSRLKRSWGNITFKDIQANCDSFFEASEKLDLSKYKDQELVEALWEKLKPLMLPGGKLKYCDEEVQAVEAEKNGDMEQHIFKKFQEAMTVQKGAEDPQETPQAPPISTVRGHLEKSSKILNSPR